MKLFRILTPLLGIFLWLSLTGYLLDTFISRPVNSILQNVIIIFIFLYTFGFIYYIYTRITNKNK
jgi:hypothetical protein